MFRPLIAFFTNGEVTSLGELPNGQTLPAEVLPGGSVEQHLTEQNPHPQYEKEVVSGTTLQRDAYGVLTGTEETVNGFPRVTVLGRDASGRLHTVATTYKGVTTVDTVVRDANGVVTGVTTG